MADDIATHFAKALEHKINGEYDEAETLFKSVIAAQPTNADAYHELGLVYSFRVYMDESLEALEKAVQLSPANLKYWMSLAKTHAMYGDFDKAKPLFLKILQVDPFNEEAQQQLAYLG
jgi:protein O-GlcNAc transferase